MDDNNLQHEVVELDDVCHATSELSIEPEENDQEQILNNEENYNSQATVSQFEIDDVVSSFGDTSHNLSSNQSQTSLTSESRRSWNKSNAILGQYFKKVRIPTKAFYTHVCLSCNVDMNTREIKRLVDHTETCGHLDDDVREKLKALKRNKTSNKNMNRITMLWAKVMAESNIHYRTVEAESFVQFVAECISDWKIPGRKTFSEVHMPQLAREARDEFIGSLEIDGQSFQVSAEFDHWSTHKQNYFGAQITKATGHRFFLDYSDVSAEIHTGKQITECLVHSLMPVPRRLINSIVSDSASNCKLARESLVSQKGYKHIIQHRCWAHHLNRIGNFIVNKTSVGEAASWTAVVTSILTRVIRMTAVIKKAEKPRLQIASNVRWYSTVDTMNRLVAAKDVILENLELIKLEHHATLLDLEKWEQVEQVHKVLRPITNCIAIAERSNGSLGETAKATLELGKLIFTSDWLDESILATATAYIQYLSPPLLEEREFSLFLASYLLDPRFNQNYITPQGIALACESIYRIAEQTGFSKVTMQGSLKEEIIEYLKRTGIYESMTVNESMPALNWWQQSNRGGYLKPIALRVARLRSSSANLERTFSVLRNIQGLGSMSFDDDNFLALAQVKLGLMNDKIKMEDDSKIYSDFRELLPQVSTKTYDPEPCMLERALLKNYEKLQKYIDFKLVKEELEGAENRSPNVDELDVKKLSSSILTSLESGDF